VVRVVDADGPAIIELALHRPSLDDVFLALTGRTAEPAAADEKTGASARPRRGRFGRPEKEAAA
ncbi:MAG: hypothetical protein H6Q36_721, partial [Chloroflexi bacterium]|nr:hypothetical protein [Chloroflexota bacterium]